MDFCLSLMTQLTCRSLTVIDFRLSTWYPQFLYLRTNISRLKIYHRHGCSWPTYFIKNVVAQGNVPWIQFKIRPNRYIYIFIPCRSNHSLFRDMAWARKPHWKVTVFLLEHEMGGKCERMELSQKEFEHEMLLLVLTYRNTSLKIFG